MIKMSIVEKYYNSDEIQQMQLRQKVKKDIRNHPLLSLMDKIVSKEVMRYDSDFYIHDVTTLKALEGEPFLWIVRTNGTHLIPLLNDDYNQKDEWVSKLYLKAILTQYKQLSFYLIERDKLKKINEKSAFAQIAIFEDMSKKRLELQKRKDLGLL